MIAFNAPYMPELSKKYALNALESNHQHGDGYYTQRASEKISTITGGGHVLLTPSCTHALEMASMLSNIGPGDEVILPSYTFTSAATAISKFGATPVFVDIEMNTKGIDLNQVRSAITTKTKAISWVNYAGIAPDLEGLIEIAREFELILIEDNAHGLGGSHKGRPLGSFGDFATQSFHATKNVQCGEGGALVINNKAYIERAEIIREKGTDRSQFMRGEIQKYQWVDQGSSYLLAETLAAVLLGQLEEMQAIQKRREEIWNTYEKLFQNSVSDKFNISFGHKVVGEVNVAHIFYLLTKDEDQRNKLQRVFAENDLATTFHYQPLHSSKMGKLIGRSQEPPLNAEKFASRILRLPIWHDIPLQKVEETVKKVIN
jgi:dTDP-4-amino-4,6-dideoxygalactose transaminase